MNLKKITTKLLPALFLTIFGFKSMAQQPGCFMIPDLDGYKRAYKMNYSGGQGYKEFFKTYKDSYLDTAYYIANSLKTAAPIRSGWRLTDQIGLNYAYCGSFNGKGANGLSDDENMFLKGGATNNLELDYMFGKKGMIGLGVLGGYAYYRVDQKSYEARYNNTLFPLYGVPASSTELLKSKPYEVFYLLAGPVATFYLGKKLSLDLTVKAGPANSSVVYVGATNKVTEEIIHRVQPTEQRWAIGGNAGLRLMYKVAENWALGLYGAAFTSNTEYETLDPISAGKVRSFVFDRAQSNFSGGLAIQRIWPTRRDLTYVPLEKLAPPVPAKVAVKVSIESPCDQIYKTADFPNEFKWKSNDNLEDKAEEMFTFKLYKVPGTTPILVKTQKENYLKLDSPLPAPAEVCSTDEYYYTVHSTKGSSFSEMETCSFKLKDATAEGASKCSEGEKGAPCAPLYLTRILGNEKYTRQVIKYDEGKGCKCPIDTLTRSGSRLIEYYKNYSKTMEPTTWPDGLPIPRKATGFIYEVRQVFDCDNADSKPGPAERYRMDVDRKTREVTITPMNSKKKKR